jgi:hypothetical protein
LKGNLKKLASPLLVVMGSVIFMLWVFAIDENSAESTVKITQIEQSENGIWIVPGKAVANKSGQLDSFVARLKHFHAEILPVKVIRKNNNDLLIRSDKLNSGDLLVLRPGTVFAGQLVRPIAGLDDEQLIRLTIEAGIAAVTAENLDNSVYFISPYYKDDLGFNFTLMRKLLQRAYEEFDAPHLTMAHPPAIKINEKQAEIQAKIWLTAVYLDQRNYLLGDKNTPNQILLKMDKSDGGWKVSKISGLRPLGFKEEILCFLGADLGLPIDDGERQEKKKFCMPCRQRMLKRFEPER